MGGKRNEEASEEVSGNGGESAVNVLAVGVCPRGAMPGAGKRENCVKGAVGWGSHRTGREEAVEDHADKVNAAAVSGAEAMQGAEEVMKVDFGAVSRRRGGWDEKACCFALINDLMVEELGFLSLPRVWEGGRKHKVKDVFERALMAN